MLTKLNLTEERLRSEFASAKSYDDLNRLYRALWKCGEKSVFYALFPIAIDGYREKAPDFLASFFLLQMQPHCPLSCEEFVLKASEAKLNLSNRYLPLYLITQYGKQSVREASSRLATKIEDEKRAYVTSFEYWSGFPMAHLLGVDLLKRWSEEGGAVDQKLESDRSDLID